MSDDAAGAVKHGERQEAGWTRRRFMRETTGALAVVAAGPGRGAEPVRVTGGRAGPRPRPARYRAVSWWLTFEDLQWPNDELRDAIRRRADRCAESAVNCCLIFGAHFRWDFLPLWGRLHDLLATIGAELHARDILLFDHHSSVLTHRPRDAEEARAIWQRNRHHVPFYPSAEAAATWEYDGTRLDDWRMRDVETGAPVHLPVYAAEQYCMNHPGFRAAYARYVRELVAATGIDGLMSDDGIYYADWWACGCPHCRERFRRECGRELPPVTEAGFWGNRDSAAFRDWIALRFRSSGDFLGVVRAALPAGFPLLTCCASSDGHTLPAYGMSYQDFIRHCDHIVLEMVGSTPAPAGTWDSRIPSQLLHLGLARAHRVPCFGLGYGFFPDTAFFIWALNKFLGSDCWFSTLKGRLGATAAQLAALADDPELVAEGYRWERDHPRLFTGEADTDLAILFARATRDFHGQVAGDYVADYHATCLALVRAGVGGEVVTEIPAPGRFRRLVVSSAVCLDAGERRALADFLGAGGWVIATGPCGFLDGRAEPAAAPWLQEMGLAVAWENPVRPGGFPPYRHFREPVPLATCRVPAGAAAPSAEGWYEIGRAPGRLTWRPERMAQRGTAAALVARLAGQAERDWLIAGWPAGWSARRFRDGHRRLIHALPAKVTTVLHPQLKNQIGQQPVIERLEFPPLGGELIMPAAAGRTGVVLHSPDLAARHPAQPGPGGWRVSLEGVRRYFVLEVSG